MCERLESFFEAVHLYSAQDIEAHLEAQIVSYLWENADGELVEELFDEAQYVADMAMVQVINGDFE